MLTKSDAKRLVRDYIPKGRRLTSSEAAQLRFRPTEEHEVHQCGRQVGDDIQSGPIFCGQLAEFIAEVDEHTIVVLCERHKPKQSQLDE